MVQNMNILEYIFLKFMRSHLKSWKAVLSNLHFKHLQGSIINLKERRRDIMGGSNHVS